MNDRNTQDDLELLRRAGKLEQSIEPARDLWPDVQQALDSPDPARRRPVHVRPARRHIAPLALAAAVLVGVSATATLWFSGLLEEAQPGPAATPLLAVGLNPELVQTRAQLLGSLERELDRMPLESRQAVAQSLNDIDAALANIHAAFENNPNSELLLDLLVSTYTDQVTLLGELDGLTRSVNRSVSYERTNL